MSSLCEEQFWKSPSLIPTSDDFPLASSRASRSDAYEQYIGNPNILLSSDSHHPQLRTLKPLMSMMLRVALATNGVDDALATNGVDDARIITPLES
nr:hypothetical protein Iba_chr09fCG12990 [Ipomoea batatas]GME14006.1 hypothetical protein Iba_scaffold14897CG0450 [Ipomoea batatas]